MGMLETWGAYLAGKWDELRLAVVYYGWLVVPAVVALVLATWVLVKALPRQRRREDLSGEDHRVR